MLLMSSAQLGINLGFRLKFKGFMDTVRRKAEKAAMVGKSLVKVLVPYGDAYIKQFNLEFNKDKEVAFKLNKVGAFTLADPEGLWKEVTPEMQVVCNNLVMGCLYTAMHLSQQHLNPRLNEKIQRYLELEFFNVLDQMETIPGGRDVAKG